MIKRIFKKVTHKLKHGTSRFLMLQFGIGNFEPTWENYMGDWTEPCGMPDGNDLTLYEMPIVETKTYDYNHALTIIDSKRKYGQPDLDTLGSLLCAACAEIELLRGKSSLGYYANSIFSSTPHPYIHAEDLKNVGSILNKIPDDVTEADFILSSPGGNIDTSLKLAKMIRARFDQLSFLLAGATHSSATMLSFSGDEIIMQSTANMSPINPRINGFDTYVGKKIYWEAKFYSWFMPWALKHLNEARILDNGVTMRTLKYAERLVHDSATANLNKYLFKTHRLALLERFKTKLKIKKIVKFFTDFSKHWTHDMPFFNRELMAIGLPVKKATGALDEKLRVIDNICEEITSTKWHNGSHHFYVRKIYFSGKHWLTLNYTKES